MERIFERLQNNAKRQGREQIDVVDLTAQELKFMVWGLESQSSYELNILCRMLEGERFPMTDAAKKAISAHVYRLNFAQRSLFYPLYLSQDVLL